MRTLLTFEYQPCWASQLVKQFGLRVRLLSEKARSADIQDDSVILGKSKESVEDVLRFLRRYPHILGIKVTKRSPDGLIVRLRVNIRRQICPLYAALQMDLGETEQDSPIFERVNFCGKSLWILDSKKAGEVTNLLSQKFQIRDIQTKVKTEKDEMRKSVFLLKEVYERGYFDLPKKTSLRQVAKEMGIPVTTLSTDIRRTLRDVIDKATR